MVFRRNVITVARKGETSISQIAGTWASPSHAWALTEDRRPKRRTGLTGRSRGGDKDESPEVRNLRRRNRMLEQESQIPRRATTYFACDVPSR
jgi:transposase-like protein